MTICIAWAITRKVELAATIGVADTLVKLVAFYIHERAWLRVHFGRKDAEYEI